MLNICTKYIANCLNLVTKDLFDVMKQELLKNYYNKFLKPGELVEYVLIVFQVSFYNGFLLNFRIKCYRDVKVSILVLEHWPVVDRHAAIATSTFEEFKDFVEEFNKHMYIQCLVQGNMTKEDVIKHIQNCVDILKFGPLLSNTMPQLRMTELPLGIQYCKIKNFNKTDVNSIVANYYQSGLSTIKLTVIVELLIMIMEEPLFNQLRTQEQLGYDVVCSIRDAFGILGYTITVYTQADKHSTEHVDGRIETFLQAFNKVLEETSEKEFRNIKKALIKAKQCADIHLKEEVDRNWCEIIDRDYVFDRLEKEIIAIDSITIEELKNWMEAHTINGNNLRKLSIHIVGTDEKADAKENLKSLELNIEKEDFSKTGSDNIVRYKLEYLNDQHVNANNSSEVYITDIESFKNNLSIYPIQKT